MQGIEAFAVQLVVEHARAQGFQRRVGLRVAGRHAAERLMPALTHLADQHAPEIGQSPGLVA